MLIVAAVIAILVQSPVSEPSVRAQPAAEQLAKATSLPDSEMFGVLQTNLPPARLKSVQAAMVESQADAAELRSALAAAYARHLTLVEMEGAIEFFESPLGASFERKMLKQQGEAFTADETRAAQAFFQSPIGRAFQAKLPAIGEAMRPALKSFGEKLIGRAQAIHCRTTSECGPFFEKP
jgi:hypothetical protein